MPRVPNLKVGENERWSRSFGTDDMLRVRNGSEATTAEHQVAIGAVAAAEIEAKQNNGPQALEYLSKAGKWTPDTATKIGVVVAASAIKTALGMP